MLALAACCLLSSPRASAVDIISTGSSGKYLDDGSDQGTAWQAIGFDDSAWSSGPAQLGYGDGDEVTTNSYGPDGSNKYITTYFRHSFVLTNAPAFQSLTLNLLRDDGAIIYINGTEVRRDNMPDGAVDNRTTTSSIVGGADEDTFFPTSMAGGILTNGTNVCAVEIHQHSGVSSDISFDFALIGAPSASPVLVVRGPYLQMGTPTSAVVRWRTDTMTNAVAHYGTSASNLNMIASNNTITSNHVVQLRGLSPDTRYYYSYGHDGAALGGGDTKHFFVTSPNPGALRPMRFWVLGDSGTANSNARSVRDAFYRWHGSVTPDLLLMLGDNAYNDGTDTEYQKAVFNMYPDTLRNTFLWSTLGNHDGNTASSSSETGPYYDILTLPRNAEAGGTMSGTEAYYSFDYGMVHFVCLNSHDVSRATNGAMMLWLDGDLAATRQKWLVAFWHHPPYSKGSHDSDIDTRLVEMRENALPILESHGVDLVLCGHSHSYERSMFISGHYADSGTFGASHTVDGGDGRVDGDGAYDKENTNGAAYVVAGSSGQTSGGTLNHAAMYLSLNALGSCAVDVDGNRMDVTFINDRGGVADHFSIVKGPKLFELAVATDGHGTITPDGGIYESNTLVSLNATPSNYYEFAHWTGDVTGTLNHAGLVMDATKSVAAFFDPVVVAHGVPQWWLAEKGLGTNDADAFDDQDGDNASTWEEYYMDTNPDDSNSLLGIRIDTVSSVEVSFESSTGRIYSLECAEDVLNQNWTPLDGQTGVPGTGTTSILTDTNALPMRKQYRVRVGFP